MLMMFIYFMFMITMFFFCCLMFFFNNELFMVFEWIIYSYSSMKFSLIIYLDYYSFLFLLVVSMISMIVFIYSLEYMSGDLYINRFSILVFMFILSMYMMILSPSMMTILIGWDGLGLISYCLVIYYQSNKAYNSGMLTVFSNRIGDVGILMMISLSMMNGSWNLMLYNFNSLMVILIILIAFTKSAQIPFTLWLPAAMMAPTPVSSLVHSSTLVTAGVYLLIRYNKFLFMNNYNEVIFFICSLTMFMAGLIANYEFDFKKIIALSTLSQLSLMMSILSLGFWDLAFFHLIIHALFKSLMFLCVGSFIHYFNNSQDVRMYGGVIFIYPFKTMILILSLLCLMGFPFLSGYYSKDLIMEVLIFKKINIMSLILMLFSTMFTVSYSVRLIMLILFSKKNYYVNLFIKESLLMNFCMLFLMLMIIFIGYMYYKVLMINYTIILSMEYKFLVMKLLFYGLIFGIHFYYDSLKFKYLGNFMNKMFFIESYYQLYDHPMYMMKLYENMYEKHLIEIKIKFLFFKYWVNLNYFMSSYNLLSMIFSNLLIISLLIYFI